MQDFSSSPQACENQHNGFRWMPVESFKTDRSAILEGGEQDGQQGQEEQDGAAKDAGTAN